MLRHVDIARRRRVVELGAGWGHVCAELAQRCRGSVLAIDTHAEALRSFASLDQVCPRIQRLQADAHQLPLATSSCDLVVTQSAFLWFTDPEKVVSEIVRVLTDDGALAAIEPDFGGMIEYPEDVSVRKVWLAALPRCGADPSIGRKLPGLLGRHGLKIECFLLDRIAEAQAARFDFLSELPLTGRERAKVARAKEITASNDFVHLPYVLISATRTSPDA